jgi:hypothetical protein
VACFRDVRQIPIALSSHAADVLAPGYNLSPSQEGIIRLLDLLEKHGGVMWSAKLFEPSMHKLSPFRLESGLHGLVEYEWAMPTEKHELMGERWALTSEGRWAGGGSM